MTKAALKDQIGRNVLSYVDGIVVVSKKEGKLHRRSSRDLQEHVRGQTQTQFREVRIWDHKGKSPQLSDPNKRHRSKPQQNQDHHSDESSAEQERCA
jgi:hypothetical protein